MIYDLIGDIHGFIGPLRELLSKLDYTKIDDFLWEPPEGHMTIFIGDYIDRGTSSVDVLKTVKAMVDADYATALLGNHEYNAILFHTPDNNGDGFLRPRIKKNIKQHQETLLDFKNKKASTKFWINWFKTLPLYFETENLLAIHACPEIESFNALKNHRLIKNSHLTDEFILLATEKNSDEYIMIEKLLKGPEHNLPEGISITDKDNHIRSEIRCNWWSLAKEENEFTNWSQIAISIDEKAEEQLSEIPLTSEKLHEIKQETIVPDDKFIFVGHYWESGKVQMKTDRVVCLDYSIGKGGKLVCFSFDEDVIPADDCFTIVKSKDLVKNL